MFLIKTRVCNNTIYHPVECTYEFLNEKCFAGCAPVRQNTPDSQYCYKVQEYLRDRSIKKSVIVMVWELVAWAVLTDDGQLIECRLYLQEKNTEYTNLERLESLQYYQKYSPKASSLSELSPDNSAISEFSDTELLLFQEPLPLAKHVISAATNGHDIIYVTRNGNVRVHGWENFVGFPNAKKVYASRDSYTLWIRSEDGTLYGMGNNNNEHIQPHYSQKIIKFPDFILECDQQEIRYGFGDEWHNISTGYLSAYRKEWTEYSELHRLKEHLINSDVFLKCVKQYGAANVELNFDLNAINQIDYRGKDKTFHFEVSIDVKNNFLFHPEKTEYQSYPALDSPDELKNALDVNGEWNGIKIEGLKKIDFYKGYWYILQSNGSLFKAKSGTKLPGKKVSAGIEDFAIAPDMVVALSKNGKLFYSREADALEHLGALAWPVWSHVTLKQARAKK